MAALNLDAKAVKVAAGPGMVAMQNGCICCSLNEDLLKTVGELAESKKYDYLVVESTGTRKFRMKDGV